MLYENYQELCNEPYFVDKSAMIEKLNVRIRTTSKYVCVTRPRRFGKSKVVDMLGAYYSKAVEASNLFDKLQIADSANYKQHMNQYNVIYISFNRIPDGDFTYNDYIGLIRETLVDDLKMKYPNLEFKNHYSLRDMLHATQDKFIFLFDEWDYIFNKQLFEEHQNDFLEFLRNLLKDQSYVALAYMTGVLPIKRYSSGSALNMFDEFTFLKDRQFSEYFGFTEEEVVSLYKKNEKINFNELQDWYNGYLTADGIKVYNPRSVIKALQNNHCESYWTNTGAMEEVVQYLKYNTLEVRDDVIEMVSGAEIDVYIDEEFRAGQAIPKTREEIYSAMIVLGFLSYHDGYLKIPNKELMKEFEKALKDKSFGYVNEIIHNSRKVLKATIQKDTQTIEEIFLSNEEKRYSIYCRVEEG